MRPSDLRLRLDVLGPLSVSGADGEPTGLSGLPALVFAYLVDRGVPVSRSELTALFWPEVDATRGRHGLRQALSRIRGALGSEVLVGTDPVRVDSNGVGSDVDRFRTALAEGDVGAAMEFWRGPFLNGDAEGLGWELSEWVELRRRDLEALLLDVGRGAVRALMADDEFEAALDLVERIDECVAGDAALAMDAAELLLELGRPHEAGARLMAAGLDANHHPRAAGILRRATKVEPEPVHPENGVGVVSPEPDLTRSVGDSGAPPGPRRRWGRGPVAVAGMGAVTVLALAGWVVWPAPLPDVSVYFCAHRETQYGFRLDLPEGGLDGVLTEPGCPILPLNGDTLLVFRPDGSGGTEARIHAGFENRVVYRNAGRLAPASQPVRRAGAQDGVVSPDGRWVLLSVERTDRSRDRDPTLPDLPDEGPVPGVAGLRSDPIFDWDVVLLDWATGEERVIGPPEANIRDARFTPDGDAVVYVSDATGNGDLYRLDLESGETTRLTSDPRMARAPVVGREWTVFWLGSGTDEDPEDVAVLNHATGEVRLLHPEPWNQAGSMLSPDERRVCWTSKRLGHFEADIAVARIDGRGSPRILGAAGRDDTCRWLGNDHVIFTSWRGGPSQLYGQELRPWSRAQRLTVFEEDVWAPAVRGGR